MASATVVAVDSPWVGTWYADTGPGPYRWRPTPDRLTIVSTRPTHEVGSLED